MSRDKWLNVLKVVVTLSLLAVVAWTVDLGEIWRTLALARGAEVAEAYHAGYAAVRTARRPRE